MLKNSSMSVCFYHVPSLIIFSITAMNRKKDNTSSLLRNLESINKNPNTLPFVFTWFPFFKFVFDSVLLLVAWNTDLYKLLKDADKSSRLKCSDKSELSKAHCRWLLLSTTLLFSVSLTYICGAAVLP